MIHIVALELDPVEPRVVTVCLGPEASDESVGSTGGPAHVVAPVTVKLVPGGHLGPFTILDNLVNICEKLLVTFLQSGAILCHDTAKGVLLWQRPWCQETEVSTNLRRVSGEIWSNERPVSGLIWTN